MRLGIFGGTFDPIHRGHLVLANCCLEQASLDALWFVPAARQPLKPVGPHAAEGHRLAMLELAVALQPEFAISTIEFDRGDISYTVETLESIHQRQHEAELYFLMGADSLADLPRWHRAAEVCQLAVPLVVHRAGHSQPDFEALSKIVSRERLDLIRRSQVEMPATPISSSAIRKQIACHGDWQSWVVPEVADYIGQHQLYRE